MRRDPYAANSARHPGEGWGPYGLRAWLSFSLDAGLRWHDDVK